MALKYSIGQRITGRVCAADESFSRLEREVARVGAGETWGWFAERMHALELSLADLGGFDEQLAEAMESPYGWLGPKEVFEKHEKTEDLCAELEALTAAFFVTLQPRLNAVKVAAKRVYEVASSLDELRLPDAAGPAWPLTLESAWQIANYIKHSDEWTADLDKRQLRCFEALANLGVARIVDGQREFDRCLLISVACTLSGETWLQPAIGTIVQQCVTASQEVAHSIQADFARIADDVEAVRIRNIPKWRVRATDDHDDEQ
jgi:hypothetical protein